MHSYRGFPSQNKPHFFKIFFPELLGKKLSIPPAFLRHIENETNRVVSLTGPSGNSWKLDLVKDGNGMSLQNGWHDFVVDNSISANDFLLFRYEGGLCFTVMIFDMTACEKDNALTVESSGDLTHLGDNSAEQRPLVPQVGIESGDGGEENTSNVMLRQEPLVKEEDPELPLPSNIQKLLGGISKERNFQLSERIPHNDIANRTPIKEPYKVQMMNTYKRRGCSDYQKREVTIKVRMETLISNRRPVTEDEVKKAYEVAMLFKSDHPTTLVVMKESYVYSGFYMNFPVSFVREHLSNKPEVVKLWDPNENSWIVKYVCYKGHGGLSAHWGAFSQANNLEQDDVCVFELIHENEMRVHIFRVVEELTPLSRMVRKNYASFVGESSINQVVIGDDKIQKKLEALYQQQQFETENEMPQPTSLKRPRFEVTMKHHNLCASSYLHVPNTFEEWDYLSGKQFLTLVDPKGQSWKISLRRYYVNNRPTIRFAGGWLPVRHEYKLEEGDVCVFELLSKGDEAEMSILVHKKEMS